MRIPMALLTQTCLIKPFVGDTPTGPKYGTEFESRCRLEVVRKKYVSSKGKEYTGYSRLFLPPDTDILALEQDSQITVDSVSYTLDKKTIQRGFTVSHVEGVVV